MSHKIKSVTPLKNYTLSVIFQNGIEKIYDMHNLFCTHPPFNDLQIVPGLFEQVVVDTGGYGISWNDELDLDAEELWENGIKTQKIYKVDFALLLGDHLTQARVESGLTQKQLSEKTGIYQADISKIERGISNPSLATLQRLAEGMNMSLKIDFVPK